MPKQGDRLYVGIAGHVVAVDSATGSEIWRTKLKTSAFATVWAQGKHVYGGAQGELFCLDASTGDILWRNPLKGLRQGIVAFASNSVSVASAGAAAAQAAAVSVG